MPLKTYHNLPEERQKEILNICFEEFAMNDYESASLTRIVEKLGVAKGSFYRYFENKQDLYIYLIDFARDLNSDTLDTYFKDPAIGFYEALVEYFLSIIKYETDYPFYLNFSLKVAMDRNTKILGKAADRWSVNKREILYEILEFHRDLGNIRKDVDIEVLYQMMRYLSSGMREHLYKKFLLPVEKPRVYEHLCDIPDEIIRTELNQYTRVISSGFNPVSE